MYVMPNRLPADWKRVSRCEALYDTDSSGPVLRFATVGGQVYSVPTSVLSANSSPDLAALQEWIDTNVPGPRLRVVSISGYVGLNRFIFGVGYASRSRVIIDQEVDIDHLRYSVEGNIIQPYGQEWCVRPVFVRRQAVTNGVWVSVSWEPTADRSLMPAAWASEWSAMTDAELQSWLYLKRWIILPTDLLRKWPVSPLFRDEAVAGSGSAAIDYVPAASAIVDVVAPVITPIVPGQAVVPAVTDAETKAMIASISTKIDLLAVAVANLANCSARTVDIAALSSTLSKVNGNVLTIGNNSMSIADATMAGINEVLSKTPSRSVRMSETALIALAAKVM